jgi:hypothetical protein
MDTFSDTMKIARAVEPHYNSRYGDGNDKVLALKSANFIILAHFDEIFFDSTSPVHIVFRPNHGLCHGIRQGLLALRLVDILTLNATPNSAIHELNNSSNFRFNIQCAASFQRTGRESEIGKSQDPKLYSTYESSSVNDCMEFLGNEEYSEAIRRESNTIIAKIIHCAHLLDLRRIPHFDKNRIKDNFLKKLFGGEETRMRLDIFNELWDYSGRLLKACGDRDSVMCRCGCYSNRKLYSIRFVKLSNDTDRLVTVLTGVQ